ncbi:MAG: FecR domain-containing protein [Pseudomonadales bacterium]
MSDSTVDGRLHTAVCEASEWYARLSSDEASGDAETGWLSWLNAEDIHRDAWQQVEAVQESFRRVPRDFAVPALKQADISRRELLRKLSVIAVFAPIAWAGYRVAPWQEWQATYKTAIGERREFILLDGSSMALDTDSSSDVEFSEQERLIRLHQGEVLITTAPDVAVIQRPFRVETKHGVIQALGTRFTVRVEGDKTQVTVLEKAVRISLVSGSSIEIKKGQRISFTLNEIASPELADISAGSWINGSLMVVNMPLGQLISELARYRQGLLSCDSSISKIKVSGAFPLENTDQALDVLVKAFPVRQRRLTRYWVSIIPA